MTPLFFFAMLDDMDEMTMKIAVGCGIIVVSVK